MPKVGTEGSRLVSAVSGAGKRLSTRVARMFGRNIVLLGLCLGALVCVGCGEKSKQSSDSAESMDRPTRKRFMLENQGTRVEVSIPKVEGESARGSYTARIFDPSGSVQTIVGNRAGYLQDAWLVDVGNDDDTQLVVWVQPESGVAQLDWYELREGEWRHRSLPIPGGDWTYEIRRGVLFAEPVSTESAESKKIDGWTFSVPANEWEPGVPSFD